VCRRDVETLQRTVVWIAAKNLAILQTTASWWNTGRCPVSCRCRVAVTAGDKHAAANLCSEPQTETSEASPGTSSLTDGTYTEPAVHAVMKPFSSVGHALVEVRPQRRRKVACNLQT